MREIDEGYLTPHAMIDPAVLEKHCKIIDYSVAVYQIFSKIMLTKFDFNILNFLTGCDF